MGKSPAKWIRSVFLGKKGSKSGTSKKSGKNKESLVSAKEPSSYLSEDLPLSTEPHPASTGEIKENSISENEEAAKSLSNEAVNTSVKTDDNAGSVSTLALPEDSQKLRLEQAATKAQAALRGYMARREFQTLKDTIKLQAVIRGHLVRRQAAATFCSLLGIVKIQALVRGQIVRRSIAESEILRNKTFGNQASGDSKPNTSIPAEQLLKNAFTEKLFSSSPSTMPLQLKYGPGEPNSADEWLMRWTKLQVWVPNSQPEQISDSKKQGIKTDQAMRNQSGRKIRSNKIENGSSQPSLEPEKVKSNPKKAPHHPQKSASENQGNEIEKVRRNLKKISKPIPERSVKPETDSSAQNVKKSTSTLAPEISGKGSDTPPEPEKPADLENLTEGLSKVTSVNELCSVPADLKALPSQVDDNTSSSMQNPTESSPVALELSERCDENPTNEQTEPVDIGTLPEKLSNLVLVTELSDTHASKSKPEPVPDNVEDITTSDEGLKINHEQIEIDISKNSQRRASLPLEAGTRTARKLPSYMAPTQSAKAKVREQASPRFGQEVMDNNALTRRYSMPSTNGKLSSSPRVQRLVQASGKEGIKIDRSLSASRDGSDKAIRADWKR